LAFPHPSLLIDAGAFIAVHNPGDRDAASMAEFYATARERPRFGHWYTVDGVVGEAYTFLRREAGPAHAREFLQDLRATGMPIVLPMDWTEVSRLLLQEDARRLGKAFTFVDASLVATARRLAIGHVLTTNPGDFRPFGLIPVP
jgi:predicted nucleic acid-binding protein